MYIRLIVEAYFMMLISCFSEIYELDLSNKIKEVSFFINIAILIFLLTVLVILIWQICKAHPILNYYKQRHFLEFFGGLRNTTYSRIICAVFVVQRILSCIVVIFLANFNLTIKLSILTVIQASHLIYLLIVRPYEDRKDFLLECISQFIVVFYSGVLIKCNTKENWTSFINWMLIISIMTSALTSFIISLLYLFISFTRKLKQYRKNKKRVENYRKNNYGGTNISQHIENNLPSRINDNRLFEEKKNYKRSNISIQPSQSSFDRISKRKLRSYINEGTYTTNMCYEISIESLSREVSNLKSRPSGESKSKSKILYSDENLPKKNSYELK